MKVFPVTAILGTRQCGKTWIANTFAFDHYFDLESPRDRALFKNPQLTLEKLTGLIVIDEVQRAPELFPLLRHLVDSRPDQKYLILGSASGALLHQSSESLAGRIGYYELTGFASHDLGNGKMDVVWLRGGLPRATLAENDADAFLWLENYVTTFLERDIPALGISVARNTLHDFWVMLSHYHAQELNFSELGKSFGVSDMTVRRYLDILRDTFMVRILRPWSYNTKKRLVKRPKIYVRDSGIFHSLQNISSMDSLLRHPRRGASWEGFALENAARSIGKRADELFFWRVHAGAEIDLLWTHEGKRWAVEFKHMDAPAPTQAMHAALKELDIEHLWVIYPGSRAYQPTERISVIPFSSIGDTWQYGMC